MPSEKKRVNLTIPDDVYQKLQEYKKENALENDATACLQLVILQLRAQENTKILMNAFRNVSKEDMLKMSNEGLETFYSEIEKQDKK